MLDSVFDQEKFDSIIDVMPDIVSVWKVVMCEAGIPAYTAPHMGTRYKEGLREAVVQDAELRLQPYPLFYHFWVNRTFVLGELNEWLRARMKELVYNNEFYRTPLVIECVVHKKWITTIGRQWGGLAVVAKKAVFPRFTELKPNCELDGTRKADEPGHITVYPSNNAQPIETTHELLRAQ